MNRALGALGAGRELTRPEELLWTSQRLHPDAPLYNMASLSRIAGPVDPDRFAAAVAAVARASDTLRTVFIEVDGHPTASEQAIVDVPHELRELPFDRVAAWAAERIAVPLRPEGPAWESVLLRHGPGDWSWWLDVHHLLCDAAGVANLFAAVADRYHGVDSELATAADHRADLAALALTDRHERARTHWADWDAPAGRMLYRRHGSATETLGTRLEVDLDSRRGPLVALLDDERFRCISRDLGLLALTATVTATWINRITGAEQLVLGVPFHNRVTPDAKRLIGLSMELFPLAVEVQRDDSFVTLYQRVLAGILATMRHSIPGTSPRQDFDAVINVVTASFGSFGDWPARTEWVHNGHVDPHHPVRVQLYDFSGDAAFHLALDVNHDVADPDQRNRVPDHIGAVIDAFMTEPESLLGSFSLLTEEERGALTMLNQSGPGATPDAAITTDIAARLRSTPDVVLVDGERRLTGPEFLMAIEETASALRTHGIGPGRRVAVRMSRSADAVVAIHAIWRAGASFVPIDPSDPRARQERLIDRAGIALVLDELPLALGPVDHGDDEPDHPRLEDEAYLLFTSGSTGEPKGVPISHRGLAEYADFAVAAYTEPNQPPTMPLFTSLGFDLTITTLVVPPLTGGTIVVRPEDPLPAIEAIASDPTIDTVKATPSHLELLVRLVGDRSNIATLIVGGEQFDRSLADRLVDAFGAEVRVFNEYGPTEAVVGCMIHRHDVSDQGNAVPIGRPAPGVRIGILDRHGHPVPLGCEGELAIHRPGMTEGYLGLPELNAELFIVPPGGDRTVYRSGDRAVLGDDGVMRFLGRIDEQVKVGGIRLEPGEVEATMQAIDGIDRAVVRLWRPQPAQAARHCQRCGVPSNVPDLVFDEEGICSECRHFERVARQADEYFRTPDDLRAEIVHARARRTGDHDVLHLLSGGKDSSYALYRLVEMGADVHALTLDNGFISEGAIDNVRRVVEDLGVSHDFVTTPAMNEIFRDSLERYSNVCNGCYKTIYTLGVTRAHELGIPVITTGLSRGQFFETRLTPGQFEEARFDTDRIDAAVLEARKVYHRTDDAATRLLDTSLFTSDDIFDEIRFIDFYRYVDVELAEMLRFLDERAPWIRPADTGRSTNCLINAAGISVHLAERGFHNYALPYSWDVRLGHKTREEAMEELDDPIDERDVAEILAEVGYVAKPEEVWTAWFTRSDGAGLDTGALREQLAAALPAHAVPEALIGVERIPLTTNGKVQFEALPPPERIHRPETTEYVPPATPTEARLAELWAEQLGRDRVGVTDDFFDIGGSSLQALEMIVVVGRSFGVELPEAEAFRHRTIAELASLVDAIGSAARAVGVEVSAASPPLREAIPILADDLPAPLSTGQRGLLFDHRLDPSSPRYLVTERYRLTGPLDVDRLERSMIDVVARHETLTTTFSEPRRELAPLDAVSIRRVDGSENDLDDLVDREARLPLDLDHGPLVRVVVVRHDDLCHDVVMTLHHASCDAASLMRLWADLATRYEGRSLEPLPVRYRDHMAWQAGRVSEADTGFFHDMLDGVAPAAPVWPSPEVDEDDGYLTRDTSIRLDSLPELGRPASIALVALAALVRRTAECDGDDVLMAMTTSTRDHPDAEPLVGYLLNTLPLRLAVDLTATGRDLVSTTESAMAAALLRRHVPYATVVRDLSARAHPDRFMFVYDDSSRPSLPGCELERHIVHNGTAVTDLTTFVYNTDDGARLAVEYSGRIGRAAAEAFLDSYETILGEMLRRVGDSVGALPLRRDDGVLAGAPLDHSTHLVEMIDASLRTAPERAAVRCGDRISSARMLDEQARRIGAALRARGVGPGDRVGVVVPRSVELIAAIWGVLRIGAGYVPIDVATPAERRNGLLLEAGVAATITGERTVGSEPAPPHELAVGEALGQPADDEAPVIEDGPAYVIFTSGSTGVPKGVEIHHRNLAASTAARCQEYGDPPIRYLMVSSPGFDSSVAGIFWTLATGGELVLPTEAEVGDIDALVDVIDRAEVTHLLCVPGVHQALLKRGRGRLRSLTDVIVAGDACPVTLVRDHQRMLDARLHNEYGPTEATVWSTVHHVEEVGGDVPIGHPVPGTTVAVIDAAGDVLPDGLPGELVVAGPGVAAGYIGGDPDGRFAPLAALGSRVYRTGDRVVAAEGMLRFLGRTDDQVSIDGHRIEPSEVERVLLGRPGVSAAVVTSDGSRLVAFVESTTITDGQSLRAACSAVLPRGMVPHHVEIRSTLPRTANGKIDRATLRLSAPTPDLPAGAVDDLDRPAQEVLSIWQVVLERPALGPDDDFFAEGGDSLRAVELVLSIQEQLGIDIGVTAVLDHRTPRRMSEALARDAAAAGGWADDASEGRTGQKGLSSVVRSGGDDVAPLVLLPPGGGNPLTYEVLAQAMEPGRPIYGLRAPGADGRERPLESIEEVATRLLPEVIAASHDRPVHILGWSTGGLMAYEIAVQLLDAGGRPGTVVLIDTLFPGRQQQFIRSNRKQRYLALLRRPRLSAFRAELTFITRKRIKRARRMVQWAIRRRTGRPLDPLLVERWLTDTTHAAASKYRPRVATIDMLYLAARDGEPDLNAEPWRELIDDVEVRLLAGTHAGKDSVMEPHRIAELAEILDSRLSR